MKELKNRDKESVIRPTEMIRAMLVLLVFVAMICGIVFTAIYYVHNKDVVTDRVYEGRFYLKGDEYEGFKQYLADNPDVSINKMNVLASPDALIDMRLTAPADKVVPYGEMTREYYKFPTSLFIPSLGGILALWMILTIVIVIKGGSD